MPKDDMDVFTDYDPEVTLEKILNSMLSPENIAMKTEISDPVLYAQVMILATYLKDLGIEAYKYLVKYIDLLNLYYTSYKRKRPKEIIEAISSAKQKLSSIKDKLTQNLIE